MAIYRLETKLIGRRAKDKAGKPIPGKEVSIVAKAAYRSGDKLRDEARDKIFNYRARAQEVVHSEILAPEIAAGWIKDGTGERGRDRSVQRDVRERLWNTVEAVEKRKDSQLARELVISLPVELEKDQQVEAIREWCHAELVSKGFVADFSLHRSKDGKNPHAHILATLRPVEGEGFGKKPDMSGKFNGRGAVGVAGKSDLEIWRASWEKQANAALEKAGSDKRVDHRSLKDRGEDRAPEPKIGVAATAMKRQGKLADPERVKRARWVRMWNSIKPHVSALKSHGDTFPRRHKERNGPRKAVDSPPVAETLMQRARTAGADSASLAALRRARMMEAVGAHVRDIQRTGEVSQSGGGAPWWAAVPLAMGWAAKKAVDAGRKVASAAVDTVKTTHQALIEARARQERDRTSPEWER